MIKFISLQGFLNLSEDAEEKIKMRLGRCGLKKNDISTFDDADDFLDAVDIALDGGNTVVLAAENEEFNAIKRQLMERFGLEGKSSPEIAEVISREREERIYGKTPDMEEHCFIPSDAEIYLTKDGLYSGFLVEFANGAKMIYLPLDADRLDILLDFTQEEIVQQKDSAEDEAVAEPPEQTAPIPAEERAKFIFSVFDDGETDGEDEEEEEFSVNLRQLDIVFDEEEKISLEGFEEAQKNAERAVYTLIQRDKTIAFVNSEESEYIKAIGEKLNGFDDAVVFVSEKLDDEESLEPQIALAKKTRLALRDTGANICAGISPVIKSEKDGEPVYYTYIVLHDGTSAKAKKVSTKEKSKENLLPHAFAVMFDLINERAGLMTAEEKEEEKEETADRRKRKATMAACIAVAVVAVVSAVVMVAHYFTGYDNPYATTDTSTQAPSASGTVSVNVSTEPSTEPPSSSTDGNPLNVLTTDPNFSYPIEDTAGIVTNQSTAPAMPSQSGTFTFNVYGYGHGVGMSQVGANYYADYCGWNYIEILALYYYGTVLVMGDSYPETITYGGQVYTTRDYLAVTVESEMGSSFNSEALKAQAVATYTYAKYNNYNVVSTAHAFDKSPSQQAYAAVDAVIGQYITYNGQVCQTFYHAMSAGKTTSYDNAYGGAQIAYLAGGRPSYGDMKGTDYNTTVTYTSDEIKAIVKTSTGIELTGDPSTWFTIISHDACLSENVGYVSAIKVGDKVFTGNQFRRDVLNAAIRSHCFTVTYTPVA